MRSLEGLCRELDKVAADASMTKAVRERAVPFYVTPLEAEKLLQATEQDPPERSAAHIAGAIDRLTAAIEAATAPPATDVAAIACEPPRTWVAYELLGHRSGVAISWEGEVAGRRGLWLDVLQEARRAERHVGEKTPVLELRGDPVFYSNGAIFSIRPLDGAEAAAAEWRDRHGYAELGRDGIPF